jgi:hypothetical protein
MKRTGIPSSNEQSETGTSYQPAQLLQLPSMSIGLTLGSASPDYFVEIHEKITIEELINN